MARFKLAFGIHNHQPVGNFHHVIAEAQRQAYRPFLELLASYENIAISLHQSGILWDWQLKNDPSYVDLVGDLVEKEQIEPMTGGFYEPILTSIPERDARGQIAMLSRFLRDHFCADSEGLWLTERIWEPHLPKLLAESGVSYLPIDDTHFIYTGLEHKDLTGPFVTEEEGHTVKLLPIQKKLRYLIPFGTVEELIGELREQAEKNPDGMAVYADDGEKFGVWPKTHQHCYDDGWLRQFFDAVTANSDWLEIVTLGRAAQEKPAGRVYLPTASYEEMLHWALPPSAFVEYEEFEHWLDESGQKERYGRFVRGSHWRGFLAKYEESNLMHKKMLRVSDEFSRFQLSHPEQKDRLSEARHRLYASQCNCPYWHGVFGGLYLPHIRQAIYGSLIEAHRLCRTSGGQALTVERTDYDRDGVKEIVCESDNYTAVFKPDRGGMLLDLSLNRHGFSVTDTLTRRREGYHLKLDQAQTGDGDENDGDSQKSIHDLVLTKEEGLSDYLVDDKYLRRCFIDHFFGDGVEFESFVSGEYEEIGDFVQGEYQAKLLETLDQVAFSRVGHLRMANGTFPVRVTKQFNFDPDSERIEVVYFLSSSHPGGVDANFAVENNFNFQAGHAHDRFILVDRIRPDEAYLDSIGAYSNAKSIALVDEYRALAVVLSGQKPADIWHLPIFTVSLSEGGFERVYQGTTLLHRYRLHLTEQPVRLRFTLAAGEMKAALADSVPEVLSCKAEPK